MSEPNDSSQALKKLSSSAQRIVSFCVVIGVAAWFTLLLARIAGSSSRFPRSDEARHGLDAIRLADAVTSLDPISFLRHLWGMAYWPPTYPLIELPAVLAFGTDYSVPRTVMTCVFGATLVATFASGLAIGGVRGIWAGLIATSLVAASPFLQLYGTVIMLELPGALLTLLSFLTYARYRRTRQTGHLKLACIASLALFFCKYNFGILWMAAGALFEISDRDRLALSAASMAQWADRALQALSRTPPRRRAFLIFLAVYAGFLLAIVLSGGWTWHLAGQRISVRKLGNPVTLLALILLIRFLLKPGYNRARIREWFDSLPPRIRTYIALVFAPIAVWLLLPPHTAAFFNFVQNSPADRTLVENLLWYPRDFVHLYSPSPEIGILVLVIGLAPVFWIHRQAPVERLLTLAVTVTFLATTMHRLKEARFLLVITPLLWLSFGRVAAGLIEAAVSWRRGRSVRAASPVATAPADVAAGGGLDEPTRGTVRADRSFGASTAAITLLLLVVCVYQPMRFDPERARAAFDRFTVTPQLRPVLDAVHGVCRSSEGVVMLGLWDWFSPNLVEWDARIADPSVTERRIPRAPNRRTRRAEPERFVDRLANEDLSTVIALEPEGDPPFAAAYREESGWLPPVVASLDQDPRFRLEKQLRFPEAGYALRVYRKE